MTGGEEGPRKYGQAGRLLEDGDEQAVLPVGQDRDRAVVRVPAESPRPAQRPAQFRLRRGRFDAEPLGEALQRVPRERDPAVVALADGGHGDRGTPSESTDPGIRRGEP